MNKQLIISVGREFGSGGHVIARMLSEKYQIPLYDDNLLREIAGQRNLDAAELGKYDENPRNFFFTRTVRGYSNSPEENIARMQFDYLKRAADKGESFVVVGRCAEEVLKENPNMVSIFILGDMEQKILRTMEREHVSREKAVKMIETNDKKRKSYHNHYCQGKWGDSRNYEISVNSSRIGIDETTEILIQYIDKRQK